MNTGYWLLAYGLGLIRFLPWKPNRSFGKPFGFSGITESVMSFTYLRAFKCLICLSFCLLVVDFLIASWLVPAVTVLFKKFRKNCLDGDSRSSLLLRRQAAERPSIQPAAHARWCSKRPATWYRHAPKKAQMPGGSGIVTDVALVIVHATSLSRSAAPRQQRTPRRHQ